MTCALCDDTRWVCETIRTGHGSDNEPAIVVAQERLSRCRHIRSGDLPQLPKGFRTAFDKRGWLH